MGDKTIIVCANCGKKVRIDQFTYPDYSCPKCGEQLPYEGNHNGEYVIFCPDDICHAANTPEEVFKNGGRCKECGTQLRLNQIKHFPEDVKGRMCLHHQYDKDFVPEDFDDSECKDCTCGDCLFIDPNWWGPLKDKILHDMFGGDSEAMDDFMSKD